MQTEGKGFRGSRRIGSGWMRYYLVYRPPPQPDLPFVAHAREFSGSLRMLLSYYYFQDADLAKIRAMFRQPLDLFADSGAYSAFNLGERPIDVEQYIAWIQKWKPLLSVAAGPDVIGDPVATRTATLHMRDRVDGLPILPTFHVGSDWTHLEFWLKQPGMDYLALGGMVPYTRRPKLLQSWLDRAFRMIPATCRVHGFGMTTWKLLLRYPWHSVDSSSWVAGFRYGSLALFDPRWGAPITIDRGDKKQLLKHSGLLALYGLRPQQVQHPGGDRDIIVRALVRSSGLMEEYLTNRSKLRGGKYRAVIPTISNASPEAIARAGKVTTKVFLAAKDGLSTPNSPASISKAVRKEK